MLRARGWLLSEAFEVVSLKGEKVVHEDKINRVQNKQRIPIPITKQKSSGNKQQKSNNLMHPDELFKLLRDVTFVHNSNFDDLARSNAL